MNGFEAGQTLNYHVNGSHRNVWKVTFLMYSASGKRCKVKYIDGAPGLLYNRQGWVSTGSLRKLPDITA